MDGKCTCLRLKWELHGDDGEGREKGKVYALFPLDSVSRRAHVVQSNALLQLLHDIFAYRKVMEDHMNTTTEWQSELFYVSRSYRNKDI